MEPSSPNLSVLLNWNRKHTKNRFFHEKFTPFCLSEALLFRRPFFHYFNSSLKHDCKCWAEGVKQAIQTIKKHQRGLLQILSTGLCYFPVSTRTPRYVCPRLDKGVTHIPRPSSGGVSWGHQWEAKDEGFARSSQFQQTVALLFHIQLLRNSSIPYLTRAPAHCVPSSARSPKQKRTPARPTSQDPAPEKDPHDSPPPWVKLRIWMRAPLNSAQLRVFFLNSSTEKTYCWPPQREVTRTRSVPIAQLTPSANHQPSATVTAKKTSSWKKNFLARRSRNVSCLWQGGRVVLINLLAGGIYMA